MLYKLGLEPRTQGTTLPGDVRHTGSIGGSDIGANLRDDQRVRDLIESHLSDTIEDVQTLLSAALTTDPDWIDLTDGGTTNLHRHAFNVLEEDGLPSDTAVTIIRVPVNGLTDNGSGDVSLLYEVSGAVADHAAETDPHTGYVREADVNWVDLTDGGTTTLHTHAGLGTTITVKEEDGSPSDTAVTEIQVPNGSLTVDAAGIVSLDYALSAHVHDHGTNTGLADDDHTQYLLASAATDRATFAANWTDLTDGGATTLHSHAGGASIFAERAGAAQAVGAATTINVTDGEPVTPYTTASSIDNTAAPFIAAGRDGQLVIIRNDGSNTLTLHDTNTGVGGSLLRLTAANVTLAAGSVMAFVYSTDVGAWIEQYYLAPVAVTPAINTFTAVPTANDTADGASATEMEWGDNATHNGPTLTLAATYTGVPSVASADITTGTHTGYPYSLSTPYTSGTAPAFKRPSTATTRVWRLSATVNGTPLTRDATAINFRAPNYAGASTLSSLASANVVGLVHYLDTDAYRTTQSIAATGANYLWYCHLASYARTLDSNLYFAISGERAQFTLANNDLAVTSTYLNVSNYDCYRSTLTGIGTVTLVAQSTRPPTRRYAGKQSGTSLTEAQIEALAQSDLTESANGTWASIASIGASDRLWLTLPSVVSAPANFGISQGSGSSGYEQAAFVTGATVSVTNQYGFVDATVKTFYSITGLNSININNATNTTWSMKTQASAFNRRSFVGPHTASAIVSAEILTLDDTANGVSVLQTTIAGTYVVTISGSNYLWVCHPNTISDIVTIKDNSTGFAIAGSYRTNVTSHTSDAGETGLTMRVWRSDNVGIFPTGGTVVIT